MPQPTTTARAVFNALPRVAPRQCAQQCTRLMSTARSAPTKRPTAPNPARFQSQPYPPLVQRRFKFNTVEEAKSRYRSGVPLLVERPGLLFIVTGAGLVWYFENEKDRMQRKRIAEANKGVGKPKDQDLKGRYSLVYFGFTHCPDICPEELDKMARMFDLVEQQRPGVMTPLFVTCDPARDGPKEMKEYLAEFHPKFIGLTGTYEQIKAMCKAYRVYFSTPSEVKPGQDYLVDHSIYFYLMDPEGDFVEALGRQHSPDQAAKVILDHMKEWRGPLKRS
ncbi:hypothetical protein CHGG_06310 [Chaetomium globosum CBS 148.51]|uniref:Thioredoxin domain-containing protein n=1 Tax=Chaetomium globosum (strain ATCC 6205 / CBS 148.51 / DSM 1962 / NBRC 6347 / NRRL 1970) TaxID=306901 RepID=Q2H4V5_CHAGB|nr:uncharacterized protein CHGG_06310 [Chaetomium globosum CBS 148.51]EAQ89691.1 hypothetical protein CHGG_06310 [Chaetomium globosum CBS 148.51]